MDKIGRTGQTLKGPFSLLAAGKDFRHCIPSRSCLDNNIVLIKHCFHPREKQKLHFAARALLYFYFHTCTMWQR